MLRQGGGVAAGFQLPSQLGRCRSCWWRSRASGGPLSARSRRRAMLEEVQNRRLLVDSDSDEEAAKPSAKPVAKTKPTDILQEVSRRQSLFHPPCLLPLPRAAGPGLCSSLPGPALRRRRSPVAVLLRGRPSTSPDVRHARAAQKACVPVRWAERRQGSEGISACLLTKGMPSAGGGGRPRPRSGRGSPSLSALKGQAPPCLEPTSATIPGPRRLAGAKQRPGTASPLPLCSPCRRRAGQKGFSSARLAGEGLYPQTGPPALLLPAVDPCPRGPLPVWANRSCRASEPAGVNPSRVPWPSANPQARGSRIQRPDHLQARSARLAEVAQPRGTHLAPQPAWGCARLV